MINLIEGDFEGVIDGWAAQGASSIEVSAEQARFGRHSLKCISGGVAATLAEYPITLTAEAYSLSCELYIPAAYPIGDLVLAFSGFTSAVGTTRVSADMNLRDQFQPIHVPNVTPGAGDLAGHLRIVDDNGAPTAGIFVYLDGVQLEPGAVCTDFEQYIFQQQAGGGFYPHATVRVEAAYRQRQQAIRKAVRERYLPPRFKPRI